MKSTAARLTHANNSLDVNAANVNLLGKLVDGLIGVLVGERVHVDFHSCRGGEGGKMTEEEGGMKRRVRNMSCITGRICYVNIFGRTSVRCCQIYRREVKEESICVCVLECEVYLG